MKKVKRYIHAMQGGTVCNLKCEYCYVPQINKGCPPTPIKFTYPVEHILKALSKERLGGPAFINYVGSGETFLSEKTAEIIAGLLQEGHVVLVVSNCTIGKEIEKLCNLPESSKDHLMVCASLHYMELKRLNLLDTYFDNLNKLKKAGISFMLSLIIGESYVPYLQEIRDICLERVNILPSAGVAFDPENGWQKCAFYNDEIAKQIDTLFGDDSLSPEVGKIISEPRKEFCYAGDWSFALNLDTGNISKCFYGASTDNIFEDLDRKINFEAIGKCPSEYCVCGGLLLGAGVIPELNFPSLSQSFANRISVNNNILKYVDFKLKDNNQIYTAKQKNKILMPKPKQKNINKGLRKFISCFIPTKKLRKKIRGK